MAMPSLHASLDEKKTVNKRILQLQARGVLLEHVDRRKRIACLRLPREAVLCAKKAGSAAVVGTTTDSVW